MANNGKFLNLESGQNKLDTAIQASAGATDANKILATDSTGRIDPSLMPVGIAADTKSALASEALAAGSYVNLYNNAGTINARLADKSNNRPAHGFVLSSVALNATATVYFESANTGLTGLTPGARYYLSTAGAATVTPQTTGIHQFLGIAVDASSINTDMDDYVVLS